MNKNRADLLARLFDEAADKTPSEREAFVTAACGNDPELRGRLIALLTAHEAAGGFLRDLPRAATPALGADRALSDATGSILGRYKLLELIGEGGCGVVYVAEQREPVRRRVAVKVIKPGMDSKAVIARFEAERQALAIMDHPNIAKVLDAGATELGRPYFVMELVRGIKITDFCEQQGLSTKTRLDLFVKVCQAIQHAHQKGVIHRDIKPSNILVTLHDGEPVPKIIDFGIAKATQGTLVDATVYTHLNQFIGTPAYMSPEQAEMSGLDIDTRTDIYSLGVLLYELLTGQPPFDPKELAAAGLDAMRRTIREKEPVRPSTRLSESLAGVQRPTTSEAVRRRNQLRETISLLRGDLDWVVMKCLEKDRSRRYPTANGLAADLLRYTHCEPVMARPPSASYRLWKSIRRNKVSFAAGAAVAGALVLGLALSLSQAVRASKAEHEQRQLRQAAVDALGREALARTNEARLREKSQANEERVRSMLVRSDFNAAIERYDAGATGASLAYLARCLKSDPRFWEAGFRIVATLTERGFPLEDAQTFQLDNPMDQAQLCSGGSKLLAGDATGSWRLWDMASGAVLSRLHGLLPGSGVEPVGPKADFLAGITTNNTVRVLRVRDGNVHELPIGAPVVRLASSPTEPTLAIQTADGWLQLWGLDHLKPLTPPLRDRQKAEAFTFSEDGRYFAGFFTDRTLSWSTSDGLQVGPGIPCENYAKEGTTLSPDGQLLVTWQSEGRSMKLWDVQSGRLRGVVQTPPGRPALAPGFSPDYRFLYVSTWTAGAGGAGDFHCQTIETSSGRLVASTVDAGGVSGYLSPTSGYSGVLDHVGIFRTRDLISGQRLAEFFGLPPGEQVILLHQPGARRLAGLCTDNTLHLWDATTGQKIFDPVKLPAAPTAAQFSAEGERVLVSFADHSWGLYESASGKLLMQSRRAEHPLYFLGFSPDGHSASFVEQETTTRMSPDGRTEQNVRYGVARTWSLEPGAAPAPKIHLDAVAWHARPSRDGSKLLCITPNAENGEIASAWDVATGRKLYGVRTPKAISLFFDFRRGADFSPDGDRILLCQFHGVALLLDAKTESLIAALGSTGQTYHGEFSTDGSTVLTLSSLPEGNVASVWDGVLGTPVSQTSPVATNFEATALSPDGKLIAAASADHRISAWSAQTGELLWRTNGAPGVAVYVGFNADSSRIFMGCSDHTARCWDAYTGRPGPALPCPDLVSFIDISRDGRRVATVTPNRVQIWDRASGNPITTAAWGGRVKTPRGKDLARLSPDALLLFAQDSGLWNPETGRFLWTEADTFSYPFAHFSSDGRMLFLTSPAGLAEAWPVPPHGVIQPAWLPRLAESLGGSTINDAGALESAGEADLRALQREATAGPASDDYALWAQWFFADHRRRPFSLGGSRTQDQHVADLLNLGTFASLHDALRLSPTNGAAFLKLSQLMLRAARETGRSTSEAASAFMAPTVWNSRQATNLSPNSAEAWWTHAEILNETGNSTAALAAVEHSVELSPNDPNALAASAVILARMGRAPEGLAELRKAESLLTPAAASAWAGSRHNSQALLGIETFGKELAAINTPLLKLPTRDPALSESLVDLTSYYNFSLAHAWSREGGFDLSSFNPGLGLFGGVLFDARGVVQIGQLPAVALPKEVRGIPIGRKGSCLHFLHAALCQTGVWKGPWDIVIGRYIIHYSDGSTRDIPLKLDHNIGFWNLTGDKFLKGAIQAWQAPFPAESVVDDARLYRATWVNPQPDVRMDSVDFASENEGLPFLVALTVQEEPITRFSGLPSELQKPVGAAVVLRPAISDSAKAIFQWRKDGVDLPGQTNPVLKLGPLQAVDGGTYQLAARPPFPGTVVEQLSDRLGLRVESGDVLFGALRRDSYFGVGGNLSLDSLLNSPKFPARPDEGSFVYECESAITGRWHYGLRLTGWVTPPVTGDYVFHLNGDDCTALYLSPDDSPANKRLVAQLNWWNQYRNWESMAAGRRSGSISAAIPLVARQRYYLEALMYQSEGDDHVSVAWQMPGDPAPSPGSAPIPGRYLSTPIKGFQELAPPK